MTKLVNRAKMTTATTGTGTITLGSAVDGYQTFTSAGVVNGDLVRYVIEDFISWEIGTGTFSSGTLTRTPSESSNGGAAINLSGQAVVYLTATADDINNVETAAKLATARTISLSGDVTGSVSFDGSANANITAVVVDDSHNHIIANVDGLQTALDGKAAVSHTHTIANVTGLQAALDAKLDDTQKGVANGLAELDATGRVPAAQLPSYVDDVLEYANEAAFPATGEAGKIYVALDVNDIFRWSGTAYIKISDAVSSADQATKLATARTISLAGDVTGSTSFDGSANVTITAVVQDDSHNHIIANVDGLQTALDGKAAASHTHTSANITDFVEAVQDLIGVDVVAGSGISVSYNDTTGDTTITNTSPDQVVSLTGSGATSVSGTYPNFTISSTDTNTTSLPIENSAGTVQFTATNATGLQFAASGAASVAFDAANQRVTISSTDTNTTYTAGAGLTLTGTSFSHTDTSTQASVDNTGATFIQDVTLDTYGHVTALGSTTITPALIGAAPTSHTHAISDVTGLQTALDGKASTTHNHTLDSLSNTTITSNTAGEILKWDGTAWVNNTLAEAGIQPAGSYLTTTTTFGGDVSGTYNAIVVADDSHNHIIANVDGLQTALDAKANLASPALTGTPTAPTAAVGTNTTQLATTAFVNAEIANDAPTKTGGGASGTWGISVTGNAATATTLQTARTIALSGAATGTATSFNGSANIAIPVTALDASSLTAGTVPDARLSGTYSGFTHKLDGSNTVFTTPNSGSTNTSARTVYGLAEYRSSAAAQVGAIVFIAPNTTSTIMHQLEIAGMLYNQNIVSMSVQGYRTTGAWSDVRKISTGTVDVQTRWAVTPDGKNCLILGDVGTSWSYPHFSIVRAMFSHSGAVDSYCSGWTVAVVTDLSLYTQLTSTIADSTMVGSISGNAATATALQTARTINGVSFNGTANITVADSTKLPLTGGTLTGTLNAPTFNATSLTGGGFQGIDSDSATQPSFTWSVDQNTGMYRAAEDVIGFTANGAKQFDVGVSYVTLPTGTTAQRPVTPVTGMMRYNTTRGCFEGYNGSNWVNMSPINFDDIGSTA